MRNVVWLNIISGFAMGFIFVPMTTAALGALGKRADGQRRHGLALSILPPENATGNFVKIVQRVPVKIVFDEPPDPRYPLGSGMSVVPVVKLG